MKGFIILSFCFYKYCKGRQLFNWWGVCEPAWECRWGSGLKFVFVLSHYFSFFYFYRPFTNTPNQYRDVYLNVCTFSKSHFDTGNTCSLTLAKERDPSVSYQTERNFNRTTHSCCCLSLAFQPGFM